jgi:hypothetical protein
MVNFEGAISYETLRDMPIPEFMILQEQCQRIAKERSRK